MPHHLITLISKQCSQQKKKEGTNDTNETNRKPNQANFHLAMLQEPRLWCLVTAAQSRERTVFPQSHCIDLYAITPRLFTDGDDVCVRNACYVGCNAKEEETKIWSFQLPNTSSRPYAREPRKTHGIHPNGTKKVVFSFELIRICSMFIRSVFFGVDADEHTVTFSPHFFFFLPSKCCIIKMRMSEHFVFLCTLRDARSSSIYSIVFGMCVVKRTNKQQISTAKKIRCPTDRHRLSDGK